MYAKNCLLIASLGLLLAACGADSDITEEENTSSYSEQHRPQLHFSPPAKWMNDPNGMVFFEDEYHLFYQYYPDSTVWGPMHWGHAVSKDLVIWENLPIALAPDEHGYIFSGSAVVDWDNTSGFSENGEPPLVAIFTYHDPEGEKSGAIDFQTQGIAYSTDRGRTWTPYEANPVIPNPGIRDFRDPKVIWDTDSDQWVMVLAVDDHVDFYGSKNLKRWYKLSSFGKTVGAHGGVWECPDLFPIWLSETGSKKWVLISSINPGAYNGGSGTQYFIGEFNGRSFRMDQEFGAHLARNARATGQPACWLDFGRDNYAGVTWSDIAEDDGRRIFLGWMSNWDYAQVVPTQSWRSAMTLPRTLEVRSTPQGPRIFQSFPAELEQLREQSRTITVNESDTTVPLADVDPTQLEVALESLIGEEGQIYFELSNSQGERYRIGFNATENAYFSDRTAAGKKGFSEKFAEGIHYAPRQIPGVLIKMHLVFDHSSVELIADDGLVAMTELFFPNEDFTEIKLVKEDGATAVQELTVSSLKGIW
ncbi:MAG: glycoside hydrolase family 32 protein [Bacteroidota bacterium]